MKHVPSLLTALALVLVAAVAHAAPTDAAKDRAKAAYARGMRAHEAGDFRGAATAFAEADALAPSPVALMAALDEATLADDPVLGAELLDRSTRAEPTAALAASIEAARRKLGGRAGKIRVACPAAATCSTTIDGRGAEGSTWIASGRHTVVVRVDDTPPSEQLVDVRGDETFVVSPPPARAPAPSLGEPPHDFLPAPQTAPVASDPPPDRSGLPPAVVFVGGAVTLALAGSAGAAGILAGNAHDEFVAHRCPEGPGPDCADLRAVGQPLVVTTNVLLVGAIVAAAVTTVTALVFTDWKSDSRNARTRSARLGPAPARPVVFEF